MLDEKKISRDWLLRTGIVAVLVDSGVDLFYGEPERVERFQRTLCAQSCREFIAAPLNILVGDHRRYQGSKLLDSTTAELSSPEVFVVQNDLSDIRKAFGDVILASDFVVTNADASFVLLNDLEGEYGVVAGSPVFVEGCLGLTVEEAWSEWDLDIASYQFAEDSAAMKFLTEMKNYYRGK